MNTISDWETSPAGQFTEERQGGNAFGQLVHAGSNRAGLAEETTEEHERVTFIENSLVHQPAGNSAKADPLLHLEHPCCGRHLDRGTREVSDPARAGGRHKHQQKCSEPNARNEATAAARPPPLEDRGVGRFSSSHGAILLRTTGRCQRAPFSAAPDPLLPSQALDSSPGTGRTPAYRWFRRIRRSWTAPPGFSSPARG